MRLQTKLLLACASVLLVTAALASLVSYRQFSTHMEENLAREVGNIRALLMATRRIYHKQFLNSGLELTEKTVGFLPAHAMSRIAKDFSNWSDSGLYFNNVSDRPRNPGNRADAFELTAMGWFRANPTAKEHISAITDVDGKQYYHYTAPLRIEKYCLECHGERSAAPASIRAQYSEAWGYQLGELRGIMSIKVLMAPAQAQVWSAWRTNLLSNLAGFVAMFVCLSLLINRLLTKRLMNLERTAVALAGGDYRQRSGAQGNDEVSSLGRTIDHMADEVQKRDIDLRRIAEVTAHHLQEPARRLATYAERLSQHLGQRLDDPEARLALEVIAQQARRQKDLLRDVERYLVADQPRGQVKVTDVGKLVAKVLESLSDRLLQTGTVVTVGALPAARIDAARLADMFQVVLENALQHGAAQQPAAPASAPLRITIDGARQGARVHYRICDNGPGIEEQYRERVFRLFERLSSQGDGTGIGLAILRRIAESCGGRAWIEAAAGAGCCVVFELPAAADVKTGIDPLAGKDIV